MQVNCLNPQIIVNPLAGELIAEYGNYTFCGHFIKVSKYLKNSFLYDFTAKKVNPSHRVISKDDIDSCYVTNTLTGEIFPLYMEVPCGYCDCCKAAKVNSFVHRCKLETMFYDCLPIFLTLTYNNEKKPKCGVNLRDVQLFFKRLRINLYRKGYRKTIRYVCVSEYGSKTKRPHYHAILWNLRQTDFLSYREILEVVEKSWSNGFVCSRFIDTTDDKAFFYTSKYLCKDSDVPEGCNKTFLCSSNRGGGIGAKFIDVLSDTIVKDLNRQPKFVNRFTGKVENLFLNRYVLNRVLPSFSHSLPSRLKTDVRDFLKSYRILRDYYNYSNSYFDEKAVQIIDFFRPYFYCPDLKIEEIKETEIQTAEFYLRRCVFSEESISCAMLKGRPFYDRCREIDRRRKFFLSKLFLYDQPIKCLELRAENFKKFRSLQIQREVL